MKIKSIDELMHEHPFFAGMDATWLEFIAACGQNAVYPPGTLIAKEGEDAVEFFALRSGRVAIELHSPSAGSLAVQTLGAGAICGWSWILPPHRWVFDVRAVENTRTVRFDAACLRTKCDESPAMGYEFMKRFAVIMSDQLQALRLQLLDVYGTRSGGGGDG